MISRYSLPEMAALWSDEARYGLWLEIETAALEEMIARGLAPASSLAAVRKHARIRVDRIHEIEAEVKHDIIAFLTSLTEQIGPEGRFLHRGMTSSDVVDSAFALQLVRSADLILVSLAKLREAVLEKASAYKHTVCVGRTHGMHAEPTTLGLKFASWVAELMRHEGRLARAKEEVRVGKLSGAVGNYTELPPEVERAVLARLNLEPETVATQVVARDRHACFFSALAQIGNSLERFATEVRHLQRTEVAELSEPFGSGQKGSSAMPHKKNPILSENICGLARLLRGYALSAMENVSLWHERDISHSSVERVIGPDACIVCHFMLERFRTIIAGLVVDETRIRENVELTRGLIHSGAVLVALTEAGVTRENAYKIVQRHAHACMEGGPNLLERLEGDPAVTAALGAQRLTQLFDASRASAHVDTILARLEKGKVVGAQ